MHQVRFDDTKAENGFILSHSCNIAAPNNITMSIEVFLIGGCTLLVLEACTSSVSNKSCTGNGRTSRLFCMGKLYRNASCCETLQNFLHGTHYTSWLVYILKNFKKTNQTSFVFGSLNIKHCLPALFGACGCCGFAKYNASVPASFTSRQSNGAPWNWGLLFTLWRVIGSPAPKCFFRSSSAKTVRMSRILVVSSVSWCSLSYFFRLDMYSTTQRMQRWPLSNRSNSSSPTAFRMRGMILLPKIATTSGQVVLIALTTSRHLIHMISKRRFCCNIISRKKCTEHRSIQTSSRRILVPPTMESKNQPMAPLSKKMTRLLLLY